MKTSKLSLLFCCAAAAQTLDSNHTFTGENDYVQISAHTKVCPEGNRIPLACGACGPNWGSLQDCEAQCNADAACTHITFFDDNGCRIYNGCDNALQAVFGFWSPLGLPNSKTVIH